MIHLHLKKVRQRPDARLSLLERSLHLYRSFFTLSAMYISLSKNICGETRLSNTILDCRRAQPSPCTPDLSLPAPFLLAFEAPKTLDAQEESMLNQNRTTMLERIHSGGQGVLQTSPANVTQGGALQFEGFSHLATLVSLQDTLE